MPVSTIIQRLLKKKQLKIPNKINFNKVVENVCLVFFQRLPIGNTSVCKEGKKEDNIVKNRFKTTFPCNIFVQSRKHIDERNTL